MRRLDIINEQKILTVALAGAPNAGKSTLTNYLVGEKVSIISPKVQTTRDLIRGVFVEDNTQIILLDTPFFLNKYKTPKDITKAFKNHK